MRARDRQMRGLLGTVDPPWTPLSLGTALTSWVRGDSVVLSPAVSQMTDKSGNGRHWQNVTSQPTYNAVDATFNNQPTVQFNGIADALICAAPDSTLVSASAGTILVVGRFNDNSSLDPVYHSTNGNTGYALERSSSLGTLRASSGNGAATIVTSTIALTTTNAKMEWRHSGGVLYCRVGATEVSTAAGDTVFSGVNPYICSRGLGQPQFTLCEAIFMNTALSTSDRAGWDAYVTSRYGI